MPPGKQTAKKEVVSVDILPTPTTPERAGRANRDYSEKAPREFKSLPFGTCLVGRPTKHER